jgi:carboxypeptidase Q
VRPPMRPLLMLAAALAVVEAAPARAQTLATDDAVLRRIWTEAMERSTLEPLAQALLDSIGPRLTGSPGMERAQSWAVSMLESWGVDARQERYGTWEGWRRGPTRIELVEPRVRSLEGQMLAWSAGTGGTPVPAGVSYLPEIDTAADWDAFLRTVRGKWVLLSYPQPTCRPNEQWVAYQANGSAQRMSEARRLASDRWNQSLAVAASRAGSTAATHAALENAGAAGIITSEWPGAPGTTRVFDAYNRRTPTFELSCEDYGLVYRLAANVQSPVVRLSAEAENLGEVPVFNVVGEIRGAELPDEYVVLSAHFDTWDGSSGATDNGAGSVLMLEAMRVLRAAYPQPKRTILIGLWSGEEQGLNGSRAFSEDHPEVVAGLQALWNSDNGTGRISNISALGLVDAGGSIARWMSRVPREAAQYVSLELPGTPGSGSDYASFLCYGAPSFNLGSTEATSWDYGSLTWHSNRDTYDKLVFDDLRNNVVLTASLAYLASEDGEFTSRERRGVMTTNRGAPRPWPSCGRADRASPNAPR